MAIDASYIDVARDSTRRYLYQAHFSYAELGMRAFYANR